MNHGEHGGHGGNQNESGMDSNFPAEIAITHAIVSLMLFSVLSVPSVVQRN